jgi:uncharacterized membrane protein YjjP (DUF1212 family)/uncharacterized membrane protein YjjB (DUF3815 family)
VTDDSQTIEIPHASMRELRSRGELPSTKEGLAIELVLRVGDLLAASGAGAKDTVLVMRRVCQAYGLERAQLDVTANVIQASYYPGEGMPPVSSFRTVSPTAPNLSMIYAVNALVDQISTGLGLGRATRRFDVIRRQAYPYPAWLAGLAGGGISMSVQLFYTTNPRMLILAFITGYLLNRFVYALGRTGLPPFFQQLFGSWMIVAFAALFTWLNGQTWFHTVGYVSPTIIAVGCVFQLVMGARFVSGIQDAIDGFYVTAAARIMAVVILTAGLVVGLVSGLDLARRLGMNVYIASNSPVFGAVWGQVLAAVGTAVFSAVSFFANRRTIALTAVAAALGWGMYLLCVHFSLGVIAANFLGPLLAAMAVTVVVSKETKIPAFGVINAVGIPFVPGLMLYLGLLQLVGSTSAAADPGQGGATLGLAASVALAIAAGASLGVFLGSPLREKLMLMPRSWSQRLGKQVALSKKAHPAGQARQLKLIEHE